jgi:catechol 2,3-dioxygenase-like lactoylglutathione lyase family enzyme
LKIDAIDHLVVNVRDVERSAGWYEQVLGMRRLDYGQTADRPRVAMVFGNQRINLRPADGDPDDWMTADQAVAGSADLCFITASLPKEVMAHLKVHWVEAIEGPVSRSGARGKITSVYCRDPDANLIEISSYDPIS